jgi:hypothetical protein
MSESSPNLQQGVLDFRDAIGFTASKLATLSQFCYWSVLKRCLPSEFREFGVFTGLLLCNVSEPWFVLVYNKSDANHIQILVLILVEESELI